MNNPASSSRADRAPPHWYRQRWPWLLMSGPAVVVVASLTSAWLAVTTDDGLVANDYYKQGLLINRKLGGESPSALPEPSAIVSVTMNGDVRARLDYRGAVPARVRFTVLHPGEDAQVVTLVPSEDGAWVGRMAAPTPGRWVVTLESDLWRLPVTTVQGRLGEVTMGAARGQF